MTTKEERIAELVRRIDADTKELTALVQPTTEERAAFERGIEEGLFDTEWFTDNDLLVCLDALDQRLNREGAHGETA